MGVLVRETYEYINIGKFGSDLFILFNIRLFIVGRKLINKLLMHRSQINLDLKFSILYSQEKLYIVKIIYFINKLILVVMFQTFLMTRNPVSNDLSLFPCDFYSIQFLNYITIN